MVEFQQEWNGITKMKVFICLIYLSWLVFYIYCSVVIFSNHKKGTTPSFAISKWIFDSSVLEEKGKKVRKILIIVTVIFLIFFANTADYVFWSK